MALVMFLLMAGNGLAQDTIFNKSKTLTHTLPIDERKTKMLAQNPKVKFSHPEDAFGLDFAAFANMSGTNIKPGVAPWVGIKPFVRIKDKFTLGFNTNVIISNYGLPSVKLHTYDMYVSAKLNTEHRDYSVKIGNFSVLDYSLDFMKYMPISDFFINEYYFNASYCFPRAVIGEISNGETRAGIGYTEDGDGFYFTGHGWVVLVVEECLQRAFKIGGVLKTNNKESFGSIHFIVMPTYYDDILLEFLNMGGRFAFYGSYVHKLKDNQAAISVNGYVQSGGGISGGNIGFYHNSSGCYVVAGAIRCDPLRETENEQDNKFNPFVEFGVRKGLFPKTR